MERLQAYPYERMPEGAQAHAARSFAAMYGLVCRPVQTNPQDCQRAENLCSDLLQEASQRPHRCPHAVLPRFAVAPYYPLQQGFIAPDKTGQKVCVHYAGLFFFRHPARNNGSPDPVSNQCRHARGHTCDHGETQGQSGMVAMREPDSKQRASTQTHRTPPRTQQTAIPPRRIVGGAASSVMPNAIRVKISLERYKKRLLPDYPAPTTGRAIFLLERYARTCGTRPPGQAAPATRMLAGLVRRTTSCLGHQSRCVTRLANRGARSAGLYGALPDPGGRPADGPAGTGRSNGHVLTLQHPAAKGLSAASCRFNVTQPQLNQ